MRCVIPLLALIATTACRQPFFTPRPLAPAPSKPEPLSPGEIQGISIEHGACFGWCPTYSYTLPRGGVAQYNGVANVPIVGAYEAFFDSASFAGLATLVWRQGLFRTRHDTVLEIDASATIITVRFRDTTRVFIRSFEFLERDGVDRAMSAIDSVGQHLAWRPRP